MSLNDAQKQAVAQWLQQGLNLAGVQKRLEADFGFRWTYMEVKLLVSDLQVLPKDAEPPPAAAPAGQGLAAAVPPTPQAPVTGPADEILDAEGPGSGLGGALKIGVDKVTRPGAIVSGDVTFSDGKLAYWYIDQMGRLGVAPKEKGYRPSPADMQQFQMALEQELARQGY